MARVLLAALAIAAAASATVDPYAIGTIPYVTREYVQKMIPYTEYSTRVAPSMKRRMELLLFYRHNELPDYMKFVNRTLGRLDNISIAYYTRDWPNTPEANVIDFVFNPNRFTAKLRQEIVEENPYFFGGGYNTDELHAETADQNSPAVPKRIAKLDRPLAKTFLTGSNFANVFNNASKVEQATLQFGFHYRKWTSYINAHRTHLDWIDYYYFTLAKRNRIHVPAFPTPAQVKACTAPAYDMAIYLDDVLRRFMHTVGLVVGNVPYTTDYERRDVPPYYANMATMQALDACFPNFQKNLHAFTGTDVQAETYAYMNGSMPKFFLSSMERPDYMDKISPAARRRLELFRYYDYHNRPDWLSFVDQALMFDDSIGYSSANINITAVGHVYQTVYSSTLLSTQERQLVIEANGFLFGSEMDHHLYHNEEEEQDPMQLEMEHAIERTFFADSDFLLKIGLLSTSAEINNLKFAFEYTTIAAMSRSRYAAPHALVLDGRHWDSYDLLAYMHHIINDVVKAKGVSLPTLDQVRQCERAHPGLVPLIRDHVAYLVDRFIFTNWCMQYGYHDYEDYMLENPLRDGDPANIPTINNCFPEFSNSYRRYFGVDFPGPRPAASD